MAEQHTEESSVCISGLILQGLHKPHECPAFGTECTPDHPLGATMDRQNALDIVSGHDVCEGAAFIGSVQNGRHR